MNETELQRQIAELTAQVAPLQKQLNELSAQRKQVALTRLEEIFQEIKKLLKEAKTCSTTAGIYLDSENFLAQVEENHTYDENWQSSSYYC